MRTGAKRAWFAPWVLGQTHGVVGLARPLVWRVTPGPWCDLRGRLRGVICRGSFPFYSTAVLRGAALECRSSVRQYCANIVVPRLYKSYFQRPAAQPCDMKRGSALPARVPTCPDRRFERTFSNTVSIFKYLGRLFERTFKNTSF